MKLRVFQNQQIDGQDFPTLMKQIKATPRPWRLLLQQAHPDALSAEQIKELLDVISKEVLVLRHCSYATSRLIR